MFYGAVPAKKQAVPAHKKCQSPGLSSTMATVDSVERAYASAPATPTKNIWGTAVEPHGMITKHKKRVLICAGISVLCAAMLALALFFGLYESQEGDEGAAQISSQATSATQQTDHNALGCFRDSETNRALVLDLVDPEEMTPDVSDIYIYRRFHLDLPPSRTKRVWLVVMAKTFAYCKRVAEGLMPW